LIVARVRHTIEKRALVERGMRVLAACSGGADSGAMLFALARLAPEMGFALEAASVDHGLRAEAARDVDIARAQAEAANVPFRALAVHVEPGPSLQARAREARYEGLLAHARERGAERLAVAHTRDDQAETVVMRVLRGTGIGGLGGIAPRRHDGVVRPLIDCMRADVRAFADRCCPRLAVDASNADPRFERVRVRERIMPVFVAEDPAIVEHLAELADDARELFDALAPGARGLLATALESHEIARVSALRPAPAAVRRLAVRLWVQDVTGMPIGRSVVDQIDHALARGGEVWIAGGWGVCIDSVHARIERRSQAEP
jgi:tRNA(Ile)-lysidine synthase